MGWNEPHLTVSQAKRHIETHLHTLPFWDNDQIRLTHYFEGLGGGFFVWEEGGHQLSTHTM